MSVILTPGRWTRQPQQSTDLNPAFVSGDAVARALINPGVGLRDPYGTWTVTGAPTVVPASSVAQAAAFDASSYLSRGLQIQGDASGTQEERSFSELCVFSFTDNASAVSGYSEAAAYNTGTPASNIRFILQNNSGTLRALNQLGAWTNSIACTPLRNYVGVRVYKEQEGVATFIHSFYIDGKLVYSTDGYRQNGLMVFLGAGYPGANAKSRISLYYYERGPGCVWDEGQIRELSKNPWQLFDRRRRVLYFTPPGAPTTISGYWGINAAVA